MKIIKKVVLASMLLVMVGWAQGALAATSIAVVNSARLIKESPQAEAARARLKSEFADRRTALKSMQNDLVQEAQKLQRDKSVMSSSELTKEQNDLHQKQLAFKHKQDDYNQDVSKREKEEFNKLRKDIYDVIVKVAKSSHYDLVLSEGVVYAADKINITDKVLAQLKRNGK